MSVDSVDPSLLARELNPSLSFLLLSMLEVHCQVACSIYFLFAGH